MARDLGSNVENTEIPRDDAPASGEVAVVPAKKRGRPLWVLYVIPVLLVAIVAAGYLLLRPYTFRGQLYDPPAFAGDFTLTDQNGQKFSLSDQKGKLVMVFFGYTMCPDVCPATLAKWVRVHRNLGADADRVKFVYITVDPERDTPEQLRDHIERLNPDFVGLTGSQSELEPVWKDYWVLVRREASSSQLGYLVTHSAFTYLLDEQGRVKVLYPFEATPEDFTSDLRYLLR